MKFTFIRKAGTIAFLAVLTVACADMRAQGAAGSPSANSALSIPEAHLIQPAELARVLTAKGDKKPLVLQVGSHVLFEQAHIAGSEYVGPGSQAEGLEKLKQRVASLPKDKSIVLYCGCCPWNRCPNAGPAYRLMQELGYTHVKVLYIAGNLGSDWVEKGYPVERGH